MANNQPIGVAYADPQVTSVSYTPVTVASLPAASAALKGTKYVVSDATVTTYATTVAGGGAYCVPVLCNGTNWVIG
jgi:hypothetical protein